MYPFLLPISKLGPLFLENLDRSFLTLLDPGEADAAVVEASLEGCESCLEEVCPEVDDLGRRNIGVDSAGRLRAGKGGAHGEKNQEQNQNGE